MRSELDTACRFNMAEGTKLSSQNKKKWSSQTILFIMLFPVAHWQPMHPNV